jgi:hypothetical protein
LGTLTVMGYVLVPVPEELVPDVDQLLFQLRFRADAPDFDEAAMGEHILSLDEEPRALLLEVAEAVAEGRPYSDVDLAARLGMTVREMMGLLTEVNDITVRPFSGNLVFTVRAPSDDDTSQSVRRLHMLLLHARTAIEQRKALGLRAPADRA